MSVNLVGLAVLMAAVTYPFRALPLFAPTKDRLPPVVQRYLRLVGPAILAALAAGNTAFAEDAARGSSRKEKVVEVLIVYAFTRSGSPPRGAGRLPRAAE